MSRSLAMLSLLGLMLLSSGCAMCCAPYDYDYPFVGGRWVRHNPTSGRVGSAFDEAGGPVEVITGRQPRPKQIPTPAPRRCQLLLRRSALGDSAEPWRELPADAITPPPFHRPRHGLRWSRSDLVVTGLPCRATFRTWKAPSTASACRPISWRRCTKIGRFWCGTIWPRLAGR